MRYILFLLLFIFTGSNAYSQLPDSLARIFAYAPYKIPRHKIDSSYLQQGIKVERITYMSTDSFLVSAYLVYPQKKSKNHPLLIYNHWGESDKSEFLEEAIYMSQTAGFVCVLPDGPWLCPGSPIVSFKRQGYEMYRQYTLNARTAIDLALQNFKIDTNKIFQVGHSFGCNTAAVLSAVEKRIDGFVMMAGAYKNTENVSKSKYQGFVEWREGEPEAFAKWIVRMRPLDPDLYLLYKTAPALIQVANQDDYFTKEDNEEFITNTPEPKEAKYYDAGHGFNEQARKDRVAWILKQVGR